MVLWIFAYRYLSMSLFSVLWGIYVGVELLDHIVILSLTCWGILNCFPQWLDHFMGTSCVLSQPGGNDSRA